jgi:hypothetical protein
VTGSVKAGIGTITYQGDKLVYAGTNLTYTVKPAAGSTVDQVTVDDIPVTVTNNKFTLTAINKNMQVKVYFK